MTTSEQVDLIATACAKAQQELQPALKESLNPAFKSKYADLAAVLDAARVYSKHGVSIFQEAVTVAGGVAVATRLLHDSGQWLAFDPLTMPSSKPDAHGLGSATTYAKRYALAAVLAIATDEPDDDGNAAAGVGAKGAKGAKPRPVPPGYDDWLTDLTAVAENGIETLREAWRTSGLVYRTYLQDTDPARLDRLKARAEGRPVAVP